MVSSCLQREGRRKHNIEKVHNPSARSAPPPGRPTTYTPLSTTCLPSYVRSLPAFLSHSLSPRRLSLSALLLNALVMHAHVSRATDAPRYRPGRRQNDVESLRLRTGEHEMIIALHDSFTLVVVQQVCNSPPPPVVCLFIVGVVCCGCGRGCAWLSMLPILVVVNQKHPLAASLLLLW